MHRMHSTSASRLFLLRHVWLPLLAFTIATLLLELSRFDLWLADALYGLSGGTWSLRDAWVTRTLIHDDGRALVGSLGGVLLVAAPASRYAARFRHWQRGLWYLLAAVGLSAVAVNVLKEITHVNCPWDLLRYGGEFPYLRNFAPQPAGLSPGACFPAGHASAAYAWLGAYYVAREYAPRWKVRVLGGVLVCGVLFGFGQQLRGAHFISHDLWTLGICWCVATLLYVLVFDRSPANAR